LFNIWDKGVLTLSEKPFSKKEEDRFLDAAREIFENDFPNPDRVGCPGSEVVKAIAFRKLLGEEAKKWRAHSMRCSPCTREYIEFRRQLHRQRRLQTISLIAAAVALVAVIGWYRYIVRAKKVAEQAKLEELPANAPYEPSILDFKSRLLLRGEDKTGSDTPAELQKGRLDLSIYLPIGSEDGDYQLQVLQQPKSPVLSTTVTARYGQDHIAILEVKVDLTALTTGLYLFAIRRTDWSGWRYLPVYVK